MKALKRVMAGEYSRELSVKVFEAQKRLAQLSHKLGGTPGYGFRRMMISATGEERRVLEKGEQKGVTTDRVVLVPGPAHEVDIVREIYAMVTQQRKTRAFIARDLNRREIKYVDGFPWNHTAVTAILTNPKYVGCNAWGRTAQKLKGPTVRIPKHQWIMKPGATEPVIDQQTFDHAQRILADRTSNKSDEELLDRLRRLLAIEGRLTQALIDSSPLVPSQSTFYHRFGGLRQIYERIGYRHSPDRFYARNELRQRTQSLRNELVERLSSMFPDHITVTRLHPKWRPLLHLRSGLKVSVLVCRTVKTSLGNLRWVVEPNPLERRDVTLFCRLNANNDAFQDFYVIPNAKEPRWRFNLKKTDPWLDCGRRLFNLADFFCVATDVAASSQQCHAAATP